MRGWRIRIALVAIALTGILFIAVLLLMQRSRPEEELDPQVVSLREIESASEIPLEIEFRGGFPAFVSGMIPVEGDNPVDRAEYFLEK